MIRIKQKWGFSFLLFFSLVYVVIFIAEKNNPINEIKEIYFADRITPAHRTLIDNYNKKNEGKVKVIPIDFPNNDFSTNERKELLARSLRGRGDGIDLLAVDIIWVQRFAKWCEPLDKYFSHDELSRILNLTMESCYLNGELVAVPLDMVQGIMYYREDLVNQLADSEKITKAIQNDITWSEFISLGKKLNLDNPYYIFPAADYEGLICVFMELLLSIEPNYFETWGFELNTPSTHKALSLLVEFVNKHKLTPEIVTEFTEVTSYKYYLEKDALFIRGWQSYDQDFQETPVDLLKQKHLKKMAIPHFANGKRVSLFGGWNLMISKFSDKKAEVVDFVKYLLSESSQEIFYTESGLNPVLKTFYNNEKYLKKYPEIIELKKLYETGMHRPAHIEYTKYSKIISHYFTLAIKNRISVEDALNMSTQEILFDKKLVR
jgi:ABC-type glycerol-3-phosphate transport system substrate-binding protein